MASDDASLPEYQYEDLVDAGRFIRLLKITYPALEVGRLKPIYSLQPCDLGSEHTPYYALSYTWGDPRHEDEIALTPGAEETSYWTQTKNITVDDRTLPIQPNVYDFLEQLALSHRECDRLWIDAICINQANNSEKSAQISLMGKIYSVADRVILWLGKDFRREGAIIGRWIDTLAAHRLSVEQLPARCLQDMFDQNPLYLDRSSLDSIGAGSWTEHQWLAIALFYCRRWFRRLWCLQEVLLSPDFEDKTTVLIGEAQLHFGATAHSATVLVHTGLGQALADLLARKCGRRETNAGRIGTELDATGCIGALMRYKHFRMDDRSMLIANTGIADLDNSPSGLFIAVCYLLRERQATDPRDRVYSILGVHQRICLENNLQLLDFKPDYDLTTADVYLETTALLLNDTKHSLSFLASAGKQAAATIEGCPTWVINFSNSSWRPILTSGILGKSIIYNACNIRAGQEASLQIEGRKLYLTANIVGRISSISGAGNQATTLSSLIDLISELPERYQYTDESRSEALSCTLLCNVEGIHKGEIAPMSTNFRAQFKPWLRMSMVAYWMLKIFQSKSPGDMAAFRDSILLMDSMSQPDSHALLPNKSEIIDTLDEFGLRENFSTNGYKDLCRQLQELEYQRDWGFAFQGRRLFSTNELHLGLCPQSTQLNDYCCIINGAVTPFILRPTSDESANNEFELIGDAYVHGIMKGEAMQDDQSFKTIVLV